VISDPTERADWFYQHALALQDLGRIHDAIESFTTARVLFDRAGDRHGTAKSLNALVIGYGALRCWPFVDRNLQQCIEVCEEHGLARTLRHARNNRALAAQLQGQWRLSLTERRWLLANLIEDESSAELRLLLTIGVARCLRHLGFPARGLKTAKTALKAARSQNLPRVEALSLETIGDCQLDQGDAKAALRTFQDGLKIGLAIAPECDLVAEAYRRLGETYTALRELEKAERAVTEGLRIAERLKDDLERAGLLRVGAHLALERNDIETSDDLFREAIDLCTRGGFRFEHALTLEAQAFAHRTTGRVETADRLLSEARASYEALRMIRLAIRLGRGDRALSRPRPPAAPEAPQLLERAQRWEVFGIFTRNAGFLDRLEDLPRLAALGAPILIVGETGVGKELVARAAHVLSRRRGRFVDINCAAIPHTMLESELFGSRRGAFTGAENRQGLAASADGGTLFLDEIGDMPRALQAKLLRFLESSTYRPVGSADVQKVDVRLVSATNAALEVAVEKRLFRSDLFYRICGAVVNVPPLRERKEDVEFLAYHFLREACQKHGRPLPVIDSIAMARLMEYDWPGNVRELRNAVISMLAPLREGSRITKAMLPPRLLDFSPVATLKRLDAAALNEALTRCDGNISELARSLSVPRQSLYRRLLEVGIDIHSLRGR